MKWNRIGLMALIVGVISLVGCAPIEETPTEEVIDNTQTNLEVLRSIASELNVQPDELVFKAQIAIYIDQILDLILKLGLGALFAFLWYHMVQDGFVRELFVDKSDNNKINNYHRYAWIDTIGEYNDTTASIMGTVIVLFGVFSLIILISLFTIYGDIREISLAHITAIQDVLDLFSTKLCNN